MARPRSPEHHDRAADHRGSDERGQRPLDQRVATHHPASADPGSRPGLAERNRPTRTDTAVVNNAVARSGIGTGTGLLPFTGLDSRALLLGAATLMCFGGWLLL